MNAPDLFQEPAAPQPKTDPSNEGPVTLDQMIACVAREVKLREIAYPGFIKRGTMKPQEARREHRRMAAVLELLKAHRESGTDTQVDFDELDPIDE
jgi:hypothetical protein